MSRHEVIIVGAGVTGRLAKVMRPEALLLETAFEGQQRIAAMVGINYLHEEIPELVTRHINVYTGYSPDGFDSERYPVNPGDLKTLDGVTMMRYQRKCRGWGQSTRPQDGETHMAERGKRYQHCKRAWAYKIPDVDVEWNSHVTLVQPANHLLSYVTDGEQLCSKYDVLIWTAPLNALYGALGFDPTTLALEGRPIFYSSTVSPNMYPTCRSLGSDDDSVTTEDQIGALRDAVVVEYVPDENTPIYRRSVYYTENTIAVSTEAMQKIDGFEKFWPGKIDHSDEARYLEEICRSHDIILAGRFARWDPDELTHHTAKRLRSVLT